MGYSQIAIIPELEGDTTGHSDGMVSFLDDSSLGVTVLPRQDQNAVEAELQRTFGTGVKRVLLDSYYKVICMGNLQID